jgi:hypothetical protein
MTTLHAINRQEGRGTVFDFSASSHRDWKGSYVATSDGRTRLDVGLLGCPGLALNLEVRSQLLSQRC